jgi:hypothetical protein
MFDEPDETPTEGPSEPADQAREKAHEFRVHAQLVAAFEGHRKFDAKLLVGLDPELAREIQRTIGRLEKSKPADSPILPENSAAEAAGLLNFPKSRGLSTNDYHIHRRPGEVMIVRWIEGDQVETFYERLQAHFDVALNGFREDEREANEWKKEPKTLAYLAALDAVKLRMADVYLREPIGKHHIFVLSTQTADEMDILHLCETVMGVSAADIVGKASAPPEVFAEFRTAWSKCVFSPICKRRRIRSRAIRESLPNVP